MNHEPRITNHEPRNGGDKMNQEPRTAEAIFNAEAQSRREAESVRSMNNLSTACQQGEGGLKENPPCTPLKENKGRNSLFSVSVSVSRAPTRTRARNAADTQTETETSKSSLQTETETGCLRNFKTETSRPSLQTETETGCLRKLKTETVRSRKPPDMDYAEFILHGYNDQGRRYDAVQTAMFVFNFPARSNGYDNAPLLRWHLRRLGEETFRQLVYDQWRENGIDGAPRCTIAALTKRFFKVGGDVK